ncbi:MAG: sensor histidine kinase [Bacteroidota bacterium]
MLRRLFRRPISRLAIKFALWTMPAFFIVGSFLVSASPLEMALLSIAAGFIVYILCLLIVVPRLEWAVEQLTHVRKQEFESLDLQEVPYGDELRILRWEVYRTGLAVDKTIRELKKVEDHRRQFLGNVSHELKTPIFSIRGFAETLRDGALENPAVNRLFLEKVLRNADRLARLASELSEISRIESGEMTMTFTPFSLRQLAAEVVEALEDRARERGVEITLAVGDHMPHVVGDRERLRQVLLNLVDNAVKYNREGGRVVVEAGYDDRKDMVRVTVKDTGIGVAAEDIPRLTQRFFRVDRSRSRDEGGTGLGLAIVKHILAAHDTRLNIESEPGRGSRFSFLIQAQSVARLASGSSSEHR